MKCSQFFVYDVNWNSNQPCKRYKAHHIYHLYHRFMAVRKVNKQWSDHLELKRSIFLSECFVYKCTDYAQEDNNKLSYRKYHIRQTYTFDALNQTSDDSLTVAGFFFFLHPKPKRYFNFIKRYLIILTFGTIFFTR